MSQCTAKSKGSGERCRRPATPGRRTCYYHGGATPRGIALPQTRHGRYSRHLPTQLLATYNEARRDPEVLALREEIALVDARLADLLCRVESGESGATWRAVRDALTALKEALAAGDGERLRDALARLDGLIAHGVASEQAWREILAAVDQRRKLVESERKRWIEMRQLVSLDEAAELVRAVTLAVRAHVHDAATLRAIVDALGQVAPLEPDPARAGARDRRRSA